MKNKLEIVVYGSFHRDWTFSFIFWHEDTNR